MNLDAFYLDVGAWLLFAILAAQISRRKGYAAWPVLLFCLLVATGLFLLSLRNGGAAIVGPLVWLLPLLLAAAALLPSSRKRR